MAASNNTFLSTFPEVVVTDTRFRPGLVILPRATDIPNRMISFKDVYGSFQNSTLTISTTAGNLFDDNTSSVTLSNNYSFYNLYAASTKWLLLNGSQTLVQSISSLNANAVTFGSGMGWLQTAPIQTVAVSTNTIFSSRLFVNDLTNVSTISTNIIRVNSLLTASSIQLGVVSTISSFGPGSANIILSLARGDAFKPTGTSWNVASDARIKENIEDASLDFCYSDVKSLRLRRFNYISTFIDEVGVYDKRITGFIAQEVKNVIPKAVLIGEAYGISDFLTFNMDQVQMAFNGATKKLIEDKENLESTTVSLLNLNSDLSHQISTLSNSTVPRDVYDSTILSLQTLQSDFASQLSTLQGNLNTANGGNV